MDSVATSESDESSSSSSSSSFDQVFDKASTTEATRRDIHAVHLLLHEILPYSRLGVLQNQLVVSPPLALVATAPEVRVYCEEHAPYSLGGTWWLAHTTTHCVVRCNVPAKAGGNSLSATSATHHSNVLAGLEKVYTCTRGQPQANLEDDDDATRDVPRAHVDAPSEKKGKEKGKLTAHKAETFCWVSEEALLLARAQERQQAALQRTSCHKGRSAAFTKTDVVAGESFIARNSGTMALVPPQLSSNRRLLSFVRGVPASFLGFCTLAAQHGWQNAARSVLEHLTCNKTKNSVDSANKNGDAEAQGVGPSRLYVVHTQLYAICGYPESRIAHSMWWCLRRMASALRPVSLSSALDGHVHGHALTYSPAVLPSAGTPSSSGVHFQTKEEGGHGEESVNGFVAHSESKVNSSSFSSLLRFRSSQQAASLRTALRYTHEHDSESNGLPGSQTNPSSLSPTFSSATGSLDTTNICSDDAWAVTNSCSLIVSGDITFWSGTSTVDTRKLLQRHWYPFFYPVHRHGSTDGNKKEEREQAKRHSEAFVKTGAPQHKADYDVNLKTVPVPPPCALFTHGNVVLAVEHKLHRDAMHAKEAAERRRRAQEQQLQKGSSDDVTAAQHDGSSRAASRDPPSHALTSEVEASEEDEIVDVQPLLFDMGDDEKTEEGSPLHGNTSATQRETAAQESSALYSGSGDQGVARNTIVYDPQEERFLGELIHREAFQLLHCVDVTYLRLPLGAELVAERPIHPPHNVKQHQHQQQYLSRGILGCSVQAAASTQGFVAAGDSAEAREVWDARWLSCLFPRLQVLDMEGPPSFTHASAAVLKTGTATTANTTTTTTATTTAAAAVAGKAKAVAVARQYRQMVRPRELALSRGSAGTSAQTRTVPLYTVEGLWRLMELRQVILRAYPFEVLPSFERPVSVSVDRMQRSGHEEMDGWVTHTSEGSNEEERTCAMQSVASRTMELSVMGWPYVSADGLRHLAATTRTTNLRELNENPKSFKVESRADTTLAATTSCDGAAEGADSCSSGLEFSMLSLTHMDSLGFVDALQAVFPAVASPHPSTAPLCHPSSLLSVQHLTQLELSKTRVTTTTLAHLCLPLHTPQLRVLRLSSTPVDSVTSLRGLAQLAVLNLAGTRITRRGLRFVQWMPALEELFLTQCECLGDAAAEAEAEAAAVTVDLADEREHNDATPTRSHRDGEDNEADQHVVHVVHAAYPQREALTQKEGTQSFAYNIFSLGVAAACADEKHDGRCPRHTQAAQQTFPRLRVLDLSNNAQFTEQALSFASADSTLAVEVAKLDFDGQQQPRLEEQSTEMTERNGSTEDSHSNINDSKPRTSRLSEVRTPPMPQLDTLFLMHTSVSQLACLIDLCPHLRNLDVSFTPLREDGLWARVRCPRQLPLCAAAKHHVRSLNSNTGESHKTATKPSESTTGCAYVVRFPTPLQLQQLNLSGTPLSSLQPLSCAPPQDWTYTPLEMPPSAKASTKRKTSKTEAVVHGAQTRHAGEQHATRSAPPASNAEWDRLPPTRLVLYPHPAVLKDCAFDVHLRTQQAWLPYARAVSHSFCTSCVNLHRCRCNGTTETSTAELTPTSPHPVRVPDAAGYTIPVDALHWATARAGYGSDGFFETDPFYADAEPLNVAEVAMGGSAGAFDVATQWTPFPLRPSTLQRTPPPSLRARQAEDAADRSGAHGLSLTTEGAGEGAEAEDVGGHVRYGVLHLASLRQLRLGHSNITASGLAAGYGMPFWHTGERTCPDGLVELSLRGTPFLCPPYPAEALRRGGEVPAVVAMALHEEQRQLFHEQQQEHQQRQQQRLRPERRGVEVFERGPQQHDAFRGPLTDGGGGLLEAPAAAATTATPAATTAVSATGHTTIGAAVGGGAPPAPQTTLSAALWTEAEALRAVLRLHRESLRLLDVSHTAVALTTFFECVFGETTQQQQQQKHQQQQQQQRLREEKQRAPWHQAVATTALDGDTHSIENESSGALARLRWVASSQWEDVLTQGPMESAGPALAALLKDPRSVIASLVQPARPSTHHGNASSSLREAVVQRHAEEDDYADGDEVVAGLLLFGYHRRACAARRRTCGLFALEELRVLDVEDTPLGTSLKRLFPRLYHCVRDLQRGMLKDDGAGEEEDAGNNSSSLHAASSAALAAAAPTRQHRGVENERDWHAPHRRTANDEDSETAASDASSEPTADVQRRSGRGPVRMRAVWDRLLRRVFGPNCVVQY